MDYRAEIVRMVGEIRAVGILKKIYKRRKGIKMTKWEMIDKIMDIYDRLEGEELEKLKRLIEEIGSK